MKKSFIIFIFVFTCFIANTFAQVSSYNFLTGTTIYSEISGGTILGTSANDDDVFNAYTTAQSGPVTDTGFFIGFPFIYNNISYEHFAVNTNGWIILGNGSFPIGNTSSILSTNGISGFANAISALSFNLQGQIGSELQYKTLGTAPDRVLVVQWKHYRAFSATDDTLNFQIRLFETSNKIAVVYDTMHKNSAFMATQIGLRGENNSDFNNRTTLTDWSSTLAGTSNTDTCLLSDIVFPLNGTTFSWSPPTLTEPDNFTALTVSASEIDLSWALDPANDTVIIAWSNDSIFGEPVNDVVYEINDTLPGGDNIIFKGVSTVYIHNLLSSNTKYYYKAWSVDTTYTYSSGATADATTFCEVNSLPYSENFESITINNDLPGCLAATNLETKVFTYTTAQSGNHQVPHSGNKFASFYKNCNDWIFSGPIELDSAGVYPLSMWYITDGSNGWTKLEVKYGLNQDTSSMTDTVFGAIINNPTDTVYNKMFGIIKPQTNGIYYIGIHCVANSTPEYLSVDDISVGSALVCSTPTALSATNITTNSAVINWTENGLAASWQIEYGLAGFTPGSGTKIITGNNPDTISALSPDTFYDIYVRSICQYTQDSSDWSPVYHFSTICNAVNTFPYFEGFENTYTQESTELRCWENIASSGTNLWVANDTLNTYNRTPRTGTWNAFLKFSSNAWMINYFELSSGVSYTFEFYARQDITTGASLEVKYGGSSSINSLTEAIISSTPVTNGNYQLLTGTFTPDSTGIYYIGIHGTVNNFPYYLSIDDIMLMETPSCLKPGNISAENFSTSDIIINWTENNAATKWQIEYGIAGFSHGTGTKILTTEKPDTITGLIASTFYDFYIRSICSPGDTSAWSLVYTFNTSCNALNIPYSENFDGITTPDLPQCITVTNNNNDDISWSTVNFFSHSSPNSIFIYASSDLQMDDWFFTPGLNLIENRYYKLSFYYGNDGSPWNERLEVKWGGEANASEMTGGQIFNNESITGLYHHGIAVFSPDTSGVYYLGFHGYSALDMSAMTVDDIEITEVTFSDLSFVQNNITNCDTLGWYNISVALKNSGLDTIFQNDTIVCTYSIDGGSMVSETFTVATDILPGDTVFYTFTNPYHFDQYAVHNVIFTLWYYNDMNILNDTVNFTVDIHTPIIPFFGNDTVICNDQSILLDAGNPGATYLWWDNAVGQTHLIDISNCGADSTCFYYVSINGFNCPEVKDTIAVTFDACTGLDENVAASFNLFPNPANGIITIQMNGITGKILLRVISIAGQLLFSEEFENSSALFEKSIDLSNLPKGVYMLNIMNGENSIFKKLIIE